MINRDEIDPQGAVIRQTAETAVLIHEELETLNPHIEMDAKEFGEHVRNGGWRLGLLVARSVESGVGQGARTDIAQDCAKSDKISLRAFSRQAGLSEGGNTVKKYVTAWELASADGLVPSSLHFLPGGGFDFDDEIHSSTAWKFYFQPSSGEGKDPFVFQVNKVKSVESIETEIFNSANFLAQQEFSIDDVYSYGDIMERKGREIKNNCLQVAKEQNKTLSTESAE